MTALARIYELACLLPPSGSPAREEIIHICVRVEQTEAMSAVAVVEGPSPAVGVRRSVTLLDMLDEISALTERHR